MCSGRHGILRGYVVGYVSSSDWMALSLTLDVVRRTRGTLRHLVPHTAYQVRVRAYTSAGAGPWSRPILCWTSEDGEHGVGGGGGRARGGESAGDRGSDVSENLRVRQNGCLLSIAKLRRVIQHELREEWNNMQ